MERSSNGDAREKSDQELPEEGGGEGMSRQDIGEEDGERASAATALAAIGTENPLSADHGVNALGGTVAPENAVPIQSFSSAAVRTATLLERKSSFWRDCGQATNWGIGVGMADVVTATQPDVETFQ